MKLLIFLLLISSWPQTWLGAHAACENDASALRFPDLRAMALAPPPDSLPPLPQLHAAIDTFHAHAARADLLEFQESRRGNWLKYLPALGLAYTPTGAPRPGLSYSTTVIYQAKKDKQARAAKRLAILEQAQVAAQRDKAVLAPMLERHRSGVRELAAALQLLELERELLSYWQQELEAKNIGPVEFLGKRKAFLEQEAGIERLRDRLRELEAEVLGKAHFFEY